MRRVFVLILVGLLFFIVSFLLAQKLFPITSTHLPADAIGFHNLRFSPEVF